jgi:sulfate transport system substrate-binding protein
VTKQSKVVLLAVMLGVLASFGMQASAEVELLNVSYDPTRELYQDYNEFFAKQWEAKTGEKLKIDQSHGGSGKQARAVIDGLEADVVTLALSGDVNSLYEKGNLIPKSWQSRLPNNSCPYTSTIVFLVKKGNPKSIKDWDDLARDGISVITPNPKTSGGARWNFLAAWAYALKKFGGDEAKATAFVAKIYKNAPVLDTGARGSTTTFVERGIGDVLIAWENEAFLAVEQLGQGKFEIVVPSISILAEPPVAVVDTVVRQKGTGKVAQAYLETLYTPEAQEIIAKHHYRPSDAAVAQKYAAKFPNLEMVTIDKAFEGWPAAQKKFFADGGVFDQIYSK